jgi:hypothetical protein
MAISDENETNLIKFNNKCMKLITYLKIQYKYEINPNNVFNLICGSLIMTFKCDKESCLWAKLSTMP